MSGGAVYGLCCLCGSTAEARGRAGSCCDRRWLHRAGAYFTSANIFSPPLYKQPDHTGGNYLDVNEVNAWIINKELHCCRFGDDTNLISDQFSQKDGRHIKKCCIWICPVLLENQLNYNCSWRYVLSFALFVSRFEEWRRGTGLGHMTYLQKERHR